MRPLGQRQLPPAPLDRPIERRQRYHRWQAGHARHDRCPAPDGHPGGTRHGHAHPRSLRPVASSRRHPSPYANAVTEYAAWAASRLDAPLELLHTLERVLTPVALDFSGTSRWSPGALLAELTASTNTRHACP